MRVLYIAPRYHTNQVPIMKGWIREGHQVMFISQLIGDGEDHRDLKPIALGYSPVYNFFFGIENRLLRRDDPDLKFRESSKKGYPPYFALKKLIRGFEPDVVILRERSLYNIVAYHICRKLGIPAILYNQSPVWEEKREKNPLLRRLVRRLSPKYRMTVSLGEEKPGMVRDPHTYYVSFVMETNIRPEEKTYFKDNIVHFLFVARYVEWKNYFVVLPALKTLRDKGYPVHLTTVGQVASDAEKAFYAEVLQYIQDNHMENDVTCITNADRDRVFEEYRKADVFLLPSREPISVSQLEAMSCSLPVICSDLPGKATYVKDGRNGYLVKPGDLSDLEDNMEMIILDKDRLRKMGEESLKLVRENASFQNYYQNIKTIMADMKKEEVGK